MLNAKNLTKAHTIIQYMGEPLWLSVSVAERAVERIEQALGLEAQVAVDDVDYGLGRMGLIVFEDNVPNVLQNAAREIAVASIR